MGQTADQLRDQVDEAREAATQKIEDIEEKVSSAAEQVKQQFDWRHQVDNHPLAAIGAAFIGGMALGGMTGGDGHDHEESHSSGVRYQSVQHDRQHGGVGDAIRNAAKSSGFDDAMHHVADVALGSLGERIRAFADQTLAGGSRSSSNSSRDAAMSVSSRSTSMPTASAGVGLGADFSAQ
jgi:hypothetical protein